MAIIYSNRNDNTSSHTTANSLSTSTWVGGVVPVAVDQVYVVGRRTTINQTAFAKWVGTITITVASTTNFATSGFFYVNTNGGEIVKVTYTGTTSTTFTGCSVDESNSFYIWNSGQTIPNGAYVHNPAYIIEINSGQTFECNELIIQEGGWLQINDGGTLLIRQGIIVRDGRLIGRDAGTITISRPAGTAAASTVGYLNSENFPLSIIDIDGGEVRTYSTLTSNAEKDAVSISINTPTNGSFAIGDEIAIYEDGPGGYRRRNTGYTGYRDATANFKDMDEGLDVVGVSGSTVYVGMRNGARGTVKSVTTAGSQKIVEVQPDSVYFNSGDKIVINNVGYTIDSIQESEYTLYDYDFTNTSTSLSDFWTSDDVSVYNSGWVIEDGIGLKNTAGAYRELVHKYLWTREVVVEAEMSPLSNYTSGTRGTTAYGIMTSYDPSFRVGHRAYDTFKADYFAIDDGNLDVAFYIRAMSNYNNNRQDRDTTLQTITRGPALYRVDNRKMRTIASIAGEEYTTEFRRDGAFKGLVGLFVNSNPNFRCKRLTIKVPTQKLYLTTGNSISTGIIAYRSGLDHQHPSGSKVVKIASINTGNGSHGDLAFAYKGQDGSGVFPVMKQINGVTVANSTLTYIHNHDMNADYYLNLGETASEVSVTIDLTAQTQFTHVSLAPRMLETAGFYGFNGVTIYGSNDLTNWTTLYGPTNDTKKWYGAGGSYNRLAFYSTGTASYRYVKFATKGDQGGSNRNRYVGIGVHDFSEGYTIELNNASDFAIGDTITVLSDSGYSFASREYEAYQARILANADPETYMHGGWQMECTVTNKVGNKLYLDKPIFWGYIENLDSVTVVKTNRKFKIQGEIGTNNVFSDSWRWPDIFLAAGSNTCRKYLFKNIRMNYIGSYRYSGSTSFNRGVRQYSYDYWNAAVFDGVVHNMGPDGTTWVGVGNYQGHSIFRNSISIGMYSGYWNYSVASYTGAAYFNNKISGTIFGYYSDSTKVFAINYNEVATCDHGISCYTTRVDRMVIPHFNEIKFNSVKGTSGYGLRINAESVGPKRAPRVVLESNKTRGMDDGALQGQTFDGWPHVGANFMSEHTGSRQSRYRNEGFVTEGDTSTDLSYISKLENFGRFGYDLLHGVYYKYEYDYSRPDITRVYSTQGDSLFPIFGIELEVLDNIPFEIYIKFDYKYPWIGKVQDDGTDDGRLRIFGLQNGSQVGTMQYGTIPSSIVPGQWNTFSATFNSFSSTYGKAAVYLSRSAQNGYVDFRNGHCMIYTDYPNKIKVLGNTFNLKEVWDQYNSSRNMAQLTPANAKTININKLRF